MRWTFILLLPIIAAGCAVQDSHIANRAKTELVGMSQLQLESCLGVPDQHDTIGSTQIFTYYTSSSSNLSYGIPFVGGVSASNGGNCHATFRLDAGKVTEVRYSGEKNATGGPNAYCAPIVRSCMEQPEPRRTASATP